MAIRIGGYEFAGPLTNTNEIQHKAGIYVILDNRTGDTWTVIDVGESSDVKSRVMNHDRAHCWKLNRLGRLGVAVLYTPGWTDSQRRVFERNLREEFSPTCGVN